MHSTDMAEVGSLPDSRQFDFPPDFVWGAATAAYAIEGAVGADGRGPSIWDTFSHTPGKTRHGATGDRAADHYHRWREDIALMRALGLDAYRFSIAWPRIQPTGRGAVNGAGLDFYDRLVDGLLAAGIAPFVTLYHWDLPQALQDAGGWAKRDTAYAFADYAEIVAWRLGDRVRTWVTQNEPWIVAFRGHLFGEHAPGLQHLPTAVQVTHHLLLSHGLAVPRIRAASPGAQVGITLNLAPAPATRDSPADRAATRAHAFGNGLFLDPLGRGAYPRAVLPFLQAVRSPVEGGDMQIIAEPIDFLGVNYYPHGAGRAAPGARLQTAEEPRPPAEPTMTDGEGGPEGLARLLTGLHRDYPFPTYYLTEHGAAGPGPREAEGAIHDERRIADLARQVQAAAAAIRQGVPVRGYFIWSLLDNFEWGHGYSRRFGLVYIDYPTQQRLLKDSARWYQRFLAGRRTTIPTGTAAS